MTDALYPITFAAYFLRHLNQFPAATFVPHRLLMCFRTLADLSCFLLRQVQSFGMSVTRHCVELVGFTFHLSGSSM